MSSFTAPLEVRQRPKTNCWETMREMEYHATEEGSTERYVIPQGFCTDFASIPRPLWPILGHPAGRFAQAAVLHDFLYATAPVSRRRADALFYEAMRVLGVPWHQRWTIWSGVRIGGWAAWRTHRNRGQIPAPPEPPTDIEMLTP